jgi:bifunctional UDP-N-acetylglucosamine pyrophosphorylase/glucosamine-1-phosphate N-acetyltransferase
MTVGIILAAGRGSRLNSVDRNKTSLALAGKPIVAYGAELFAQTVDKTLVVVGAFAESVQSALLPYQVTYAQQTEQKGTGHAARVAVDAIAAQGWQPETICLGYGDHMMFYTPEIVRDLLAQHQSNQAAITLVTTIHPDPNSLAWGRIKRDQNGKVLGIVEQKDATPEELSINELNAGFYCFDYAFAQTALQQILPSPVTGEYYLTDLIALAQQQGKTIHTVQVPYEFVGSGINTADQLQTTEAILAAPQSSPVSA